MTSQVGAAIGIRLPNSGPFAQPGPILEIATMSESLGYDRIWVHDHITWGQEKLTSFATGSVEACGDQEPNFYESITTAALVLGRLTRVNVGIAGLILPMRNPLVLGKQLATVEHLSPGRMVAAIGIGANRGDFEVMGVPFEKRGRLTTDYLGALRAMAGASQPVSFESDSIAFDHGTFLPRQAMPIWVTGSSDAGFRRAVALGDGWMTVFHSAAEFSEAVKRLHAIAEEAGRDPASIDTGHETFVTVARTHEDAIAIAERSLTEKFETLERGLDSCMVGSTDEVLERMVAYAEAGARHLELRFIAHHIGAVQEMAARLAEAVGLQATVG